MSALDNFLAQFKQISDVIIDSYFVCDNERNIVDFNRAFFSLLPRNIARGLKGKKCYEVLALNICQDRCIAQQCWTDKKQVRLDEIDGRPAGLGEADALHPVGDPDPRREPAIRSARSRSSATSPTRRSCR